MCDRLAGLAEEFGTYTGELRTGTRVGRAKFMQCLE